MNLLITFHSVSSALYAQKVLADQAVVCKVIPIPRSVSSSCGYALETIESASSALAEMLDAAHIEWEAIYRLTADEKDNRYDLEKRST